MLSVQYPQTDTDNSPSYRYAGKRLRVQRNRSSGRHTKSKPKGSAVLGPTAPAQCSRWQRATHHPSPVSVTLTVRLRSEQARGVCHSVCLPRSIDIVL